MSPRRFPKIFIASSSESRKIAEEIKVQLNDLADIRCWYENGIFGHGNTIVDDLVRISGESDMGIFIFNKDDETEIRGKKLLTTRDNVLFEFGLFVSKVGIKRSFLFFPKHTEFHLPSDLRENFFQFDPDREISSAIYPGIMQIKESIRNWAEETRTVIVNRYFERFYDNMEPDLRKLKDEAEIDYNRSFNLLLYMFREESFKEFRALDLAFNRWEEVFKDDDKVSSQITNYSKDIISSVKLLIRTGRCTNFRRILALPIGSITPQTRRILEKMQHAENEVKDLLKKKNINGINETRILNVDPLSYSSEFRQYNDFALFTGEDEEFAIIERSLTKPNITPDSPLCIISKNKSKLKSRKDFFDLLWDSEAVPIEQFIKENFQDDKSNTVQKAFIEIEEFYGSNVERLKQVSVVVETAYIELSRLADKRRKAHMERAFELIEKISTLHLSKKALYVCSFINDFKPRLNEIECIDEFCGINETDPDKFRLQKSEVAEELKKRNNSIEISPGSVGTFLMQETRKKAEKTLRSVLLQEDKKKYFEFDPRPGGGRDIRLVVRNGLDIDLGYDKSDGPKSQIVPNCALLMAQHYYDLFKEAQSKNPHHKEFWIFDFLVHDEKKAVWQGAEASVMLHQWPKGIHIHIINCTYFDEGSGTLNHFTHKF